MKKLYFLFFLVPAFANGQTVTSVAAGNFYSPSTWDCTCIPASTDTIYVNHAVILDMGVMYTGNLLQVGGAGSLADAGSGNGILIDGGGKVTNIGIINVAGVLVENGYLNNLSQLVVDSLWTRDTVSSMGILHVYHDFRNDLDGHFTNWGTVTVDNDFLNEAVFLNNSEMYVHNDFANCNQVGSAGTYDISGFLCVYNNFVNCDTMLGNGTVTISGTSANIGEMQGNFIVNTPSGTLNSNTGNVDAGISFGVGACNVGLDEQTQQWTIYPNPADGFVTCSETDVRYAIYDFSGRLVLDGFSDDGRIIVSPLAAGVYVLQITNHSGQVSGLILRKN